MKKLFLTAVIALSTLVASAQFVVITTYVAPEDGADWETTSLTDKIGVGYTLNDKYVVGVVKVAEDSLNLWGTYSINENVYIKAESSMKDITDNLTIGIGYSYNIWKCLNIEPNYMVGIKEDENGEREGIFNLGLSYKL